MWHRLAGDFYFGEKLSPGRGGLFYPTKLWRTGMQIIGPPDSGKTRLLAVLAKQFLDARDPDGRPAFSVLVLDPHDGPPPRGGLYHSLKCHLYRSGDSTRLRTIDPCEII